MQPKVKNISCFYFNQILLTHIQEKKPLLNPINKIKKLIKYKNTGEMLYI